MTVVSPDSFIVKDSGKRQEFASGMKRDTQEGKIDFWRVLIGPMFKRLAVHVTKGAQKYPDVTPGTPNWTLAAGEEEYQRFKQSAFRHFIQWFNGDRDEDHAAATLFNINGAEFVLEKMERNKQEQLLERAGMRAAQLSDIVLSRPGEVTGR